MKLSWLNRVTASKLILFFSGWSIDPAQMNFLDTSGFDVAMLHSYDSFDLPAGINFDDYDEIIAVTYSFGVFTGLRSLSQIGFKGCVIALNGTPHPVDNRFGIRKMVFEKTLENLSVETFRQFQANMFKDEKEHKFFVGSFAHNPDIEQLKRELLFILRHSQDIESIDNFQIKPVISKHDRIFNSKNQIDFWKDFNYVLNDSGHFPFYGFKSWGEIIALCRT